MLCWMLNAGWTGGGFEDATTRLVSKMKHLVGGIVGRSRNPVKDPTIPPYLSLALVHAPFVVRFKPTGLVVLVKIIARKTTAMSI